MKRLVLDTNILVHAGRSRRGASNRLLRLADERAFAMLVSVPLFLEYEAVLLRPEQLLETGQSPEMAHGFLNYLAGIIEPVRLHYLWRPQLADIADEMVLETAINGNAEAIVTFNGRHFAPAHRFGIDVIVPSEALRRIG